MTSAVVVGGANLDVKARSTAPLEPGTSNPGTTVTAAGGVARNVAAGLALLGTPTTLVAVVGADEAGRQVLAETEAAGVDVSLVRRTAPRTGSYTAVLDHQGELAVAVSDMGACDLLDREVVSAARRAIAAAGLVVVDGNLRPDALAAALDLAGDAGVPVVLDPVSAPKARRLAGALRGRPLHTLSPNTAELAALVGRDLPAEDPAALAAAAAELAGAAHVWVRRGRDGSLLCEDGAAPQQHDRVRGPVVDVTGAGDAMLAAYCHAVLLGRTLPDAVRLGHRAAAATVASPHTVRPDLREVLALDDRSPA